MMKPVTLTAIAILTALLAACGEKAATNEATVPGMPTEAAGTMGEMAGGMDDMAMPDQAPMKMAKGTGTVTAIDPAAGTITLDHGPIAEANWPAMTMAFKARPELIGSVKVGDKIAFDLELKDGAGELTSIQKQ